MPDSATGETRADEAGEAGDVESLRAELRRARERFRSIIQKTADGMMVVGDGDGLIRFANEAAGRLFGRDPSDLVGSPFGHAVVVGETTEIDLFQRGEPVVAELRVMETDWEGESARIISLRDITDRKKAEERSRKLVREQVARAEAEDAAARAEFLAEAARRVSSTLALDETLRNVVELLAQEFADYAVLDLVEDGEVRRFAAARDVPATLVDRVRHHPLQTSGETPQARAYRDGEPVLVPEVDDRWILAAAQDEEHLELLRSLDPGSVIFVPLSTGRHCLGLLSAVRSGDGEYRDRDLHTATELGRHAALAIENARLYRDVEAANQAKANFLSVMSHELRTPLSAIIGYTDLMDRGVVGEVTAKQSEYLGRVRASSNHLLQIIEEILAFAGAEAGKDELRPEDTTLGEIMNAVQAVADPLARESSLDFGFRVEDEDAELHTDTRKVRQILLNLISNALKFTEEGSVEVRAHVEGEEAVFEVADTGVGIAPDRQESIFERFWQVEEALTRKSGGTGLGLSVARSFAQLLGGRLTVDSERGVGSTFTLRIPRTVAE